MSIMKRDNGTYVVRWSEGRRKRGRTFARRSDAERFESEVRRRKQLGGIVVLPERVSLPELHERDVQPLRDLGRERNTLDGYAAMWKHLERELGSIEVHEITPATVEALGPRMVRSGVGPTSASKALSFLSSMLNRAVVWGYIERNPCEHAQRPRTTRTRPVVALSPAQVEAIRNEMGLRDRTLVSVMALSGLRPGEALALSWDSVRDRNTIHVTRSVAHGELKSTKTGQTRSVAVIPSLARDLAEWDLASGRPPGASLVFPNARNEPWTDAKFRNWRSPHVRARDGEGRARRSHAVQPPAHEGLAAPRLRGEPAGRGCRARPRRPGARVDVRPRRGGVPGTAADRRRGRGPGGQAEGARRVSSCEVCGKPRPAKAVEHFDPFCTTACCKERHGVEFPRDSATIEPSTTLTRKQLEAVLRDEAARERLVRGRERTLVARRPRILDLDEDAVRELMEAAL